MDNAYSCMFVVVCCVIILQKIMHSNWPEGWRTSLLPLLIRAVGNISPLLQFTTNNVSNSANYNHNLLAEYGKGPFKIENILHLAFPNVHFCCNASKNLKIFRAINDFNIFYFFYFQIRAMRELQLIFWPILQFVMIKERTSKLRKSLIYSIFH